MTTITEVVYDTKSSWKLLFHHDDNTLWRPDDFLKICTIKSLKDFWLVVKDHKCPQINSFKDKCMYYLMRDSIMPTWEDTKNRHNVTISIKVSEPIMIPTWTLMAMMIVGESFHSINNGLINGLIIKYVPNNKSHINKTSNNEPFALIKILTQVKRAKCKSIMESIQNFLKITLPSYVTHNYSKENFSIQITDNIPEY